MNTTIQPAHEHPHHRRVLFIVAVLLILVIAGGIAYYGLTSSNISTQGVPLDEKTLEQTQEFFEKNPAEPLTDQDLVETSDFFQKNQIKSEQL